MEVLLSLGIIKANKSGRFSFFDVVAFYPGRQRKGGLADGWKEISEDISVMPVAHLMGRSFKQDAMVVYKKPDYLSSQLMDAHAKGTRLSGHMGVYMRDGADKKTIGVGDYYFDFKVSKMLLNQTNETGDRWERMELKIINKTEQVVGLSK